jgi:hypothetical protein
VFPADGVIWGVNYSYINVEKIRIIYKKVFINNTMGAVLRRRSLEAALGSRFSCSKGKKNPLFYGVKKIIELWS